MQTLPRRQLLHLAASAVAWPVGPSTARGQSKMAGPDSEKTAPLAKRLATYAAGLRYEDLEAETIERVKAHVIDSIGCAIAAFDERPVRICRELVLSAGGGASTIIGTSRRTMPDLAAFANGAAIRYYDLNDVYAGRFSGHPSDNIAACLAVAEAERASARELITAIVTPYSDAWSPQPLISGLSRPKNFYAVLSWIGPPFGVCSSPANRLHPTGAVCTHP